MTLIERHEEVVIQPQGRLDAASGETLKQQWTTLTPRQYKVWIVDLSRIEFIDSSGLVALVAGLEAATRSGSQLILCGLRPCTRLVFEITQLDQAFAIFDDYAEIERFLGRTQALLQVA